MTGLAHSALGKRPMLRRSTTSEGKHQIAKKQRMSLLSETALNQQTSQQTDETDSPPSRYSEMLTTEQVSEFIPHPDIINGVPWRDLKNEYHRLITFSTYTVLASKSAIMLARNGFVYEGTGSYYDDSVICVFCLLRHKTWLPEDDISSVHQRLSPGCPLVTGVDNTNVHFTSNTSSMEMSQLLPPFGRSTSDLDQTNSLEEADGILSMDVVDGYPGSSSSNNGFGAIHSDDPVDLPIEHPHSTTGDNESGEETMESSDSTNSPSELTPAPSVQGSDTSQSLNVPTAAAPSSTSQANGSPAQTTVPPIPLDQLGVCTELPKRLEFGHSVARKETFNSWPEDHHLQVDDLVKAGFYYAGYSDCVRCFHCGGGLRNWEPTDDALVEHAHWFPNCAFLKQTVGRVFINAVQELYTDDRDEVSLQDVLEKLGSSPTELNQDFEDDSLFKDPAVLAVIEQGFDKKVVHDAVKDLRSEQVYLSVSVLIEKLKGKASDKVQDKMNQMEDASSVKGTIDKLLKRNQDLRKEMTCKVCLVNPMTILFLPCGHLACCSDCAQCLQTCPICRKTVQGVVRVFLHDEKFPLS